MRQLPNRIVKRNGNLDDTIGYILAVIRDKSHQVKSIAAELYDADALKAARNVHSFLLRFIRYHLDPPGIELIRTPQASLQDRRDGIDCEDYTILSCCLLKEMGHSSHCFLTIVDLDPVPGYEHIYLSVFPATMKHTDNTIYRVTPLGIAVDMLMPFGEHPNFIQKTMQISILGTTGARCHQPNPAILAGMNAQDQRKAYWLQAADPAARPYIVSIMPYVQDIARNGVIIWTKNAPIAEIEKMLASALDAGELRNTEGLGANSQGVKRRKDFEGKEKKPSPATNIARGIARISPILIAGRAAFILMVRLNAFHFASKMRLMFLDEAKAKKAGLNITAWRKAKAALPRIENTWLNLGGNIDNLKEAISKGSGVPAARLGTLGDATLAATITAATPVLLALAPIITAVPWKELKGENGEKLEDEDIVAKLKAYAGGGGGGGDKSRVDKAIEEALEQGNGGGGGGNNTDRTPEPEKKSNTLLYVGIGLGVLTIGGLIAYNMQANKPKVSKQLNS